MLEISGLTAGYDRRPVVRDLSLTVDRGRVTLVLGLNGAGKTTTLRTIAGLHKPMSGAVMMDGSILSRATPHGMVRRGVVLVPEGRHVFGELSVEDNLRLGAHTVGRAELAAGMARSYELFPILHDRRHSRAGLLSGGEQQMLALCRALMSRPSYVLLDEPSMGLAPVMVAAVMSSVRAVADDGVGVLMVEQNVEAGMGVADDVIVMQRGEFVHSGSVTEARSSSSALRAFLGDGAVGEPLSPTADG